MLDIGTGQAMVAMGLVDIEMSLMIRDEAPITDRTTCRGLALGRIARILKWDPLIPSREYLNLQNGEPPKMPTAYPFIHRPIHTEDPTTVIIDQIYNHIVILLVHIT